MDDNYAQKHEVTGVLIFAVAVLLGLSFYLPLSLTGSLGRFLRGIGTGLIGVAAYAIPIILIYAAVDYFMEKRPGVAPVRVRSVLILLVSIAAILAVCTVSPTYVKAASTSLPEGDVKASKAVVLLWKMGMDKSLLGAPEGDIVLSGGVLGGGVALALRALAAKTGALLILIAFTISQIVLIFNISIKQTATKTVSAIKNTSHRASEVIRQDRVYRERERAMREEEYRRRMQAGNRPTPPSVRTNQPRSYVVIPQQSPFEEVGPQGFIDLEGTEVKMNQQPWSEREKNFDFDLTHDEDLSPEARKVEVPREPRVDISFSDPNTAYVPPVGPQEEEPQFLDVLIPDPTEPQPGTILASPVATDEIYDDGKIHEQGGTQIRVPDLHTMDRVKAETTPAVAFDSQAVEHQPKAPVAYAPTQIEEKRTFVNNEVAPAEKALDIPSIAKAPAEAPAAKRASNKYSKAPTNILAHDAPAAARREINGQDEEGMKLVAALKSFGIETRLGDVTRGPAITRFEVVPAPGIKVSRITNLSDDIALALAAQSVRIEAPIPGKSAVGIEVPNKQVAPVHLGNLLESASFKKAESPLTVALGKNIPGEPILCDLAKMPHLLIAGSTGSGKSVCINSILISILCHASPKQVRMIMIDPKVVELAIYNGIPHLLCPVVTDPRKAANALNWAVNEMTSRYAKFAEASVRDFRGYNEYQRCNGDEELPLILVVIDELADLMQVASKEVEESISRLTAMARAAGIHLLIATQRPSVDVITGVIKANIPSRIAFAVSSQVDSRTILDMVGAEKLLGKGDMLYYPQSAAKPMRGQGAFVTDKEVEEVISYIKQNNDVQYDEETSEAIMNASKSGGSSTGGGAVADNDGEDELFDAAVEVILETGYASVSILQRRMKLGYPRASRLIDSMADKGYIGPFEGSKPRKILIDQTQWLEIKAKKG